MEAKKVSAGPQGVLVQAERYSMEIGQVPRYQGEYGVPFLHSTNGEVTWFHDVRDKLNRSRRVSGFHTPAALAKILDLAHTLIGRIEIAVTQTEESQAVLDKAFRGELLTSIGTSHDKLP